MFENFKSTNEFIFGGGGDVPVESVCEEVLAISIVAEEAKIGVAHQTDKEPVAATVVQEFRLMIEAGFYELISELGKHKVARYQTGVIISNGAGVSFCQPIGLFGLDKATLGAAKIINHVFFEDLSLVENLGIGTADLALHDSSTS